MKHTNLITSRETKVSNRADLLSALRDYKVEYVPVSLNALKLLDDGTLQLGDQALPYTDWVHERLMQECRIPANFEQDLRFEHLQQLFEQRKHQKTHALTACISNDTVVGIAHANYDCGSATGGVIRSADLLEALPDDDSIWELDSAVISDEGLKINLLIPGATLEPEEGDVIHIGMELYNSETGNASAKSVLYTKRLVCSNGTTQRTNQTTVYMSKLGRMSYGTKLSAFGSRVAEASKLAEETARELYLNVIDLPMMDIDLVNTHRSLRRRLGVSHNIDDVLRISSKRRIEIANRVRERANGTAPMPTDLRVWDIHNAITEFGREQPLRTRQIAEEIGGDVLLRAQANRSFSKN